MPRSATTQITAKDLILIEKLFFVELKSIVELREITGFTKFHIQNLLNSIMRTKAIHRIENPPVPIEPSEFERVYSTTYQNSNFILLTNNEEIKQFRKFLT